jgi:hypothetical protein
LRNCFNFTFQKFSSLNQDMKKHILFAGILIAILLVAPATVFSAFALSYDYISTSIQDGQEDDKKKKKKSKKKSDVQEVIPVQQSPVSEEVKEVIEKPAEKVEEPVRVEKKKSERYVGEFYGGGIIFYLYEDDLGEERGFILALSDVSNSSIWSNLNSHEIGESCRSQWNGRKNSRMILEQSGFEKGAALLCKNYTFGDYDDWYLPSIHELSLLWNNISKVNQALRNAEGGREIGPVRYWSSTEYDAKNAWSFLYGKTMAHTEIFLKNSTINVRPVRSF